MILVIDDDADIRESVADLLAFEGFVVVAHANGQSALDYLRAPGPMPKVIILDLMMPVLDGWAFIRALEVDPRLAAIPVLVLSAGGEKARATVPGRYRFLAKPVDLAALLEAVEPYR